MHCFTFVDGKLIDGFSCSSRGLVLGDPEGLSCRVSLDRSRPAIVHEGRVHDALLHLIQPRSGVAQFEPFWVLKNDNRPTPFIYVRVASNDGPTRHDPVQGEPEIVIPVADVDRWLDGILLLRPGDAVSVRFANGNSFVIENVDGTPHVSSWVRFKLEHTERFVTDTRVVWGRVPEDWVGRFVQVEQLVALPDGGEDIRTTVTGKLLAVSPFVLNVGGHDSIAEQRTIETGVWVILNPDDQVPELPPEAADELVALSRRLEVVRAELAEVLRQPWIRCLPLKLQRLTAGALSREPSNRHRTGRLRKTVERLESHLQQIRELEMEARARQQQVERGEILVNFCGGYLDGLEQWTHAWVICPDGSLRDADDSMAEGIERRREMLSWQIVSDDELALRLPPGAEDFEVAMRPKGGMTDSQLETLRGLSERNLPRLSQLVIDAIFASIEAAFPRCPGCWRPIGWTPTLALDLTSHRGAVICTQPLRDVGEARGRIEMIGRTEVRVGIRPVLGGVVQILPIDSRSGNPHVALRYQRTRRLVQVRPVPMPTATTETAGAC